MSLGKNIFILLIMYLLLFNVLQVFFKKEDSNEEKKEKIIAKKQVHNPLAIVLTDLQDTHALEKAIKSLPKEITLAIHCRTKDLQKWIDLATYKGHEVLITIPLEPDRYSFQDPGEDPLLVSLGKQENTRRLKKHLSEITGFTGVTHDMGSFFCSDKKALQSLLDVLEEMQLCFFDINSSPHSKSLYLSKRNVLASDCSVNNMNEIVELNRLEKMVSHNEKTIATVSAMGNQIEYLVNWEDSLQFKDITLVPVTYFIEQ